MQTDIRRPYRGRIAPSPTGYLHLGHARTFWTARERASANGGALVLRNDDLDRGRCRPEFVKAMFEDLRWFGFEWHEGPDLGGPFQPYNQSERMGAYRSALETLHNRGLIYPCTCSRKDIQQAASAPHAGENEMIYPGTCRGNFKTGNADPHPGKSAGLGPCFSLPASRFHATWRFRVPDGETISFEDGRAGRQTFVAGKDFGDFVVWRNDDVPSYQLGCVVDDAGMRITEVVRGADLLVSTARQILLYRALQLPAPAFFHCSLMTDESGIRLAKRHDALSLRALRAEGKLPAELRSGWQAHQAS